MVFDYRFVYRKWTSLHYDWFAFTWTEMAKHRTSPQTPLLAGERYDPFRGDRELHAPVPLALDDRIKALSSSYKALNSQKRKVLRDQLSEEEIYSVLFFGLRAAALALRSQDPQWLGDGIAAMSMVDASRLDPRDRQTSAGVLFAMCHHIGVSPDPLLEDAAARSESCMSDGLLRLKNLRSDLRRLSAWLYEIVELPDGQGLVKRDVEPYRPTVSLDLLALEIGQVLKQDKYAPEVVIGSELPANWLLRIDDDALKDVISRIAAVVSINARLHPESERPNSWNQILGCVVEADGPTSADIMARIANKKKLSADFALVAVHYHQLFCLLIGNNFLRGGEQFESNESMQRFLPGIERALQSCQPLQPRSNRENNALRGEAKRRSHIRMRSALELVLSQALSWLGRRR